MAAKAIDVVEFISWPTSECLNENPKHSLDNVLKQGYRDQSDLYLESDTDEQLIVHISFTTALKLTGIVIAGPAGGQGPKRVKLFINRPTIGFSEAAEESAAQEFDLTDENLAGTPVSLRLAKFQQVNSLSVFVESNQGDEEVTQVTKLIIYGTSGESMNVADIKKDEQQ